MSTSKHTDPRAAQLKSEHLTCLLQLHGLGAVIRWAREPTHQSALKDIPIFKERRAVRGQRICMCVIMTFWVVVVVEQSTYHSNAQGQHQKHTYMG